MEDNPQLLVADRVHISPCSSLCTNKALHKHREAGRILRGREEEGRHGDLDWRTARQRVLLTDPLPGSHRGHNPQMPACPVQANSLQGSLFSLPQSLDKGAVLQGRSPHCRGNLKTATPPPPTAHCSQRGWTAGRALVPLYWQGFSILEQGLETLRKALWPPLPAGEVTCRLFYPTLNVSRGTDSLHISH